MLFGDPGINTVEKSSSLYLSVNFIFEVTLIFEI